MQIMKRGSLRLGALALAAAGLIEYALQIILSVILVRQLSAAEFGEYRLVWLLAATVLPVLVMSLPQSLFFFLPGASDDRRLLLMSNALLFHCLIGAFFFLCGSLFAHSGLHIASLDVLSRHFPPAALFIALWIAASLLDVLPTADGRATWQAGATVFFAVLRIVALGGGVIIFPGIEPLLWMICAFALLKLLAIPYYLLTSIGQVGGLVVDRRQLWQQVSYALPFGVSNGFFLLRTQSDQWIVAANFSTEVFALISVASVMPSISILVRQPINNALLPRVRALIADADLQGASQLLAKGYSAVALLLLPLLGLFFSTAHEVVELVYTRQYADAAPLMQIYLFGQVTGVFAAGHLLVAVDRGNLAMLIHGVCLALSISLSLVGVHWFGLGGAPLGSVICLVIGEWWALHTVARALRCRELNLMAVHTSGRMLVGVSIAAALVLSIRSWLCLDFHVTERLAILCFVYAAVLAGLLPALGFWPLIRAGSRVWRRTLLA
jgi:O-antigen/teichoic acid export membrane protein